MARVRFSAPTLWESRNDMRGLVDNLPRSKKTSRFWSAFKDKAMRRHASGDQQASTKSSTTGTSLSGVLRHASQRFSIRPRWPRRRSPRSNRREACTSTSQGFSDDASVVWHSDSDDGGLFATDTSFGLSTFVATLCDGAVSSRRSTGRNEHGTDLDRGVHGHDVDRRDTSVLACRFEDGIRRRSPVATDEDTFAVNERPRGTTGSAGRRRHLRQ